MFRLQNKATGQVQEFSNRAALLIGLEGEENRCLQLNLSATFQVSHYDKQENLLGSMELTIPSSSGQPVQELLGDFGLHQEAKTSFWHRPKSDNQAPTPVGTKSSSRFIGLARVLKGLFWLVPVTLSCLSLYWSSHTLKQVKNDPQEDNQPKVEQVTMDQKADVFCRYFISSYFAKANGLKDFLSQKIDKDNLETEKASPVSVLLEHQEQTSKTTKLTYVINLRYEDESVSSKRLKLFVTKDKTAKYGYFVIKAPKLTAYP